MYLIYRLYPVYRISRIYPLPEDAMFKITTPDPGLISLSTSTYQLLLTFYPNRFRREYGAHMAQVFRDCCLNTYRQSGSPGMLALWALTLFDWFKTVIEEQLNRETEMTNSKFIRLSGWAMIVAAVSMLLTFLADSDKIQRGLYQVFGLPTTTAGYESYQSISDRVALMPFFFAILLITVGLLGLRARYGEQAGRAARMALGAGVLGGVAGLVNMGVLFMGLENAWTLMIYSIGVMFGGLFVFGLIALRNKPMPRGNALPALAGFWFPFIMIRAEVYHLVTGVWLNVSNWESFTLFAAVSFFLAWLGYVLQGDTQ